MANMNIGVIQFGIDANTKGLAKAGKMITDFRKKVNDTARSQTSAAQARAKALGRQESAMKKAREAILRHNQAMDQAGMKAKKNAQGYTELDRALMRYIEEMRSGVLSTTDFARAQDGLAAKLNRSKRALKEYEGSGLVETLRNLESASVLAVGPLSGLGARIRSIGAIASRANLKVVALYGTITALAVGIGKLAAAGVTSSRTLEQIEARFQTITGDAKLAAREIEYVTGVARKMGLRVEDAARAFSRFSAAAMGTVLEGEKARKIFEGVASAAAALRLSQPEVEGTFRAIEQMLSKGTVQAEELRGQLGERLPGAFRLAAVSMKKTTEELNDMLKNGEVLAKDFLPLLAEKLSEVFGEDALKNADSFGGSLNNLSSSFLLLTDKVNDTVGLSRLLVSAFKAMDATLLFLAEHMREIGIAAASFAAASLVFTGPKLLTAMIALMKTTKLWAWYTWNLVKAQLGLNAAMLANPAGKLLGLLAKLATAAATFVGVYYGLDFLIEETAKTMDDATLSAAELANTLEQASEAGKLSDGMKSFQDELQGIINKSKAMDNAFAWGSDVDTELTRINTRMQLLGTSTKEMTALAKMLGTVMGEEVPRQIELFIDKYLEFLAVTKAREEAIENEKQAADAMAGAIKNIAEQQARLNAMQGGEAQLRVYEQITSKVNDFVAGLIESNINVEEAKRLGSELHSILVQQMVTMDEQKRKQQALNDLKKEENRLAREQEKANKQLKKAADTIDLLGRKVQAVRMGPDAIREFNEITRPLEQFRNQLENTISDDIVNKQQMINQKVAEYNDLLVQQAKLTGFAADAADGLANAIGNTLESSIIAGESFKDTMKSMADEVWKVMLRLLIIDPLIENLKTSLTNVIAPTTNASGGIGGIFGTIFGRNKPKTGPAGTGQPAGTPQPSTKTPLEKAADKQVKVANNFQDTIEAFNEAIDRMAQCCCDCKGGDENSSAITEAMDASFRASMELHDSTDGLTRASNHLDNAAMGLERTATILKKTASNEGKDSFLGNIGAFIGMAAESKFGGTPTGALGGVKSAGVTQVAEYGPEMFHSGGKDYLLSPTAGRITPTDDLRRPGRSGGGNVTNLTVVLNETTTNRTAYQNANAIARVQARVMGRNR